jgi:SulP family sulfate permease
VVIIAAGVAYAALAGMPLVTGLYAACCRRWWRCCGALHAAVGGADRADLAAGGASLSGLAEPGSARWVDLAVWLALLSGLLQLVLGRRAASAGCSTSSARPVLMGFTQAAALLIIASQLPALLGLKGSLQPADRQPQFDLRAAAYGWCSVALLLLAASAGRACP